MGVGSRTEVVLATPGRGTVDSDVVCIALSVRLYILVDDFVRVYDESRISHARVCLYFGDPVVYLRSGKRSVICSPLHRVYKDLSGSIHRERH